MLKRLFFILSPFAVLVATATAAQTVELTEEQRAAIAVRIEPVGGVCVKGEACGGLPKAPAAANASAPAISGASATAVVDAAEAVASVAPSVDGESTYNMACLACHSTGAGGAPMVGDKDAWAPRIAKGIEALHNSGVNGVAGTAMMAKGGRADLSDEAIIAAVDYMVENSQ